MLALVLGAVSITTHAASVTFEFDGTIGLQCFVCGEGSDQFGTGVVPGTPVSGRYTFDSATIGIPAPSPNRTNYFGVSAEFSVGSESISGNDPSMAHIEIADDTGDSYSLVVLGGFSSGTIAGESIENFYWVVSGTSSLFSDLSLPLDPDFFGPSLGSRVCIGDCFSGEILEGQLTTLEAIPIMPAIWLFGSALGLLGWVRRKKAS
jgi:hypothetical protein